MGSLKDLQCFLRKLDLQRHGASVFVRDDHTLILSDKLHFSNYHFKLIASKFPHVHIDVMSSSGSKSGFLILFCSQAPWNSMWQRSFILLGMHFVIFSATLACTLARSTP